MPDPIAIVGASLAGMHAAHTLRKEGYDGPVTVVDADPRAPYDRPPLSKQVLAGEWEPDRIVLPAAREDLDLEQLIGRRAEAVDLDRRVLTLDGGDELAFAGLVVATGAVPRRLPGQPDLAGVHVLRTLDDCLALRADLDRVPSRVVVVGAGFIGSEVAATCRGRGLEVTVVEAAPVPLERVLGARLGQVCADLHRDHGVDLRLGVGVAGIDGDGEGRVASVRLADGAVIDAEVVVVGVGVSPATTWLEGSGLTLDDGVVCDETLLAAPGVVAAGDLARWPSRRFGERLRLEHWENAVQQGEAAARRLLAELEGAGAPEVFDPVPWFWSDQYDRKLQLAGRSGADHDVEIVVGGVEERRFVALYGKQGRLRGVFGMNRPRQVMQLRTLLVEGTSFDDACAAARQIA